MSALAEAVADPEVLPATDPVKRRGGPPGLKPNQYRDEKGVIRTVPKPPVGPIPPPNPRTDNERGIPSRLAVFRWISEQPKHCDDTDRKKQMRVWAEAWPVRFEDKLAALEDEWAAKAPKAAPKPAESEPDAQAPFPEMEEAWAVFQDFCKSRRERCE